MTTHVAPPLKAETQAFPARGRALADLYQLTKPSITAMNAVLAASVLLIEWALDRSHLSLVGGSLVFVATCLAVAGAGAMNMAFEYRLDAQMSRTRNRPVAAGRLSPQVAALFGAGLIATAIALQGVCGTGLSVAMTALAAILYVGVYTPMKRYSSWAVVVGAVPGALPILMASTAATGTFEVLPVSLFLVLLFWQLPHFAAIAIYRQEEYARAGYVVMPSQYGVDNTKLFMIATTIALYAASLAPAVTGDVGVIYTATATVVGGWFLLVCVNKLTFDGSARASSDDAKWARRVFLATLVHQLVLFVALLLDVSIRAFVS